MSATTDKSAKTSSGGETIKVIVQALILAVVIRTFLFQPFNIPSGSMENTLLVGDYLFVSKYAYGYSRFSLPFSPPLFSGRIWSKPPERGDIVVFKLPRDESTDYIKRVIGLPGDRIQMKGGVLYINDVAVPKKFVDTVDDEGFQVKRYQETLPNGVSYYVLDRQENGAEDDTQVYEVPPDHYFMMGDNRDNSTDSRVPPSSNGVGYVPFENLIGKAQIIFFSFDEGQKYIPTQSEPEATNHIWEIWKWPQKVRWDRLFHIL
jgi:signal peptidase I